MRSATGRIALKFMEVLGSLACFITKIITDLESRQVFIRNQKLSREWGLLHNVTWSSAGNSFANITYGGFTLITTLMLISRCIDAKTRPSLTEKIFLTVGMLCFFIIGGIVLAAFDQVPSELRDNSLILGGLSFLVGFIMLFDLADPMARYVEDTTQTDNTYLSHQNMTDQLASPTNISDSQAVAQQTVLTSTINNNEISQFTQQEDANAISLEPRLDINDITKNGNYHKSDSFDYVHVQKLPRIQQPVFEQVLMPEKKRPTIHRIQIPESNATHQQIIHQTSGDKHLNNKYLYDDRQLDHHQNDDHATRKNAIGYQSRNRNVESNTQPMMVVRNYSRVVPTSTYRDTDILDKYEQDHQRNFDYHNGSYVRNEHTNHTVYRGHVANPIRPGFVANAAKLWDQKVAAQHDELNTIV